MKRITQYWIKYPWLSVGLILVGAAILRYFFIFHWHNPENFTFSDPGNYQRRGQDLLNGNFYDEMFFQGIGMPLMVALAKGLGSLKILSWIHLVLSVATLWLIWKTTECLTNQKIALLSLTLASFHYPFLFMAGVFMTECIFTFFLALFLYLLTISKFPWTFNSAWILSFVFVAGFLFKSNLVFYIPLLLNWYAIKYGFKKQLLVFLILVAYWLSLHGLMAYTMIGKFQISASNGGLNLVAGKCPSQDNFDIEGNNWFSPLSVQLEESERKKWDQSFMNSNYFVGQGIKCILDRPFVLVESLRYIPYLFINNEMWPSTYTAPEYRKVNRGYNLFFAFIVIPGLLLGFLLLLKTPQDPMFLIWILPVLSLFLLVWAFTGEFRYRIPYDVVLIPLTVWTWDQILALTHPGLTIKQRFNILLGVIGVAGIVTIQSLIKV